MCLLWRQFEKVIYMEMGTAINETRDHNGEKHRILIPTDWTFNGKLKKYWKVSKERIRPLLESFTRGTGAFHGKLQKKECDVRCKVSKEGMGPSIESFKRKNGTFFTGKTGQLQPLIFLSSFMQSNTGAFPGLIMIIINSKTFADAKGIIIILRKM